MSGRGWYREWGGEARPLSAGDTVELSAGVKHWHGAAKDSWFSHIAVEKPGQGCSTEWLEPVSDEDILNSVDTHDGVVCAAKNTELTTVFCG